MYVTVIVTMVSFNMSMNLEIRQQRSFSQFTLRWKSALKLLLNCCTAAVPTLTPPPSPARYTNRPSGCQRRYTKCPVITFDFSHNPCVTGDKISANMARHTVPRRCLSSTRQGMSMFNDDSGRNTHTAWMLLVECAMPVRSGDSLITAG